MERGTTSIREKEERGGTVSRVRFLPPMEEEDCKENLLRGEGRIEDPRERRHRLRPCCIYHIITIIEPRTTRRHLLCSSPSTTPGADRPPLPFLLPRSVLTAATANWKLANTFSLRCSLVLLTQNCLP